MAWIDWFCTGCGIIEPMDERAPICSWCGTDEFLIMDEAWCQWVTPA